MKVSEIFYSIQGEGTHIGLPTVFLRLFACDLRCSWCDTMYAVEGRDFTEMDQKEILEKVENHSCKRICITGGEPLLQKEELEKLAKVLVDKGYFIVLETSGHKEPPKIFYTDSCLISMDCKCPSSGMENKMDFTLYEKLRPSDQLKFVIADIKDYEYAKYILDKYKIKSCIIFQPAYGQGELEWIANSILNDNMNNVRVLPQLHKRIWGEKRGT